MSSIPFALADVQDSIIKIHTRLVETPVISASYDALFEELYNLQQRKKELLTSFEETKKSEVSTAPINKNEDSQHKKTWIKTQRSKPMNIISESKPKLQLKIVRSSPAIRNVTLPGFSTPLPPGPLSASPSLALLSPPPFYVQRIEHLQSQLANYLQKYRTNSIQVPDHLNFFYAISFASIVFSHQRKFKNVIKKANDLWQMVSTSRNGGLTIREVDNLISGPDLKDYKIIVVDTTLRTVLSNNIEGDISQYKKTVLVYDADNGSFAGIPNYRVADDKWFCFKCLRSRPTSHRCVPKCGFCLRKGSQYPCNKVMPEFESIVCNLCRANCPNDDCYTVHRSVCSRPPIADLVDYLQEMR